MSWMDDHDLEIKDPLEGFQSPRKKMRRLPDTPAEAATLAQLRQYLGDVALCLRQGYVRHNGDEVEGNTDFARDECRSLMRMIDKWIWAISENNNKNITPCGECGFFCGKLWRGTS